MQHREAQPESVECVQVLTDWATCLAAIVYWLQNHREPRAQNHAQSGSRLNWVACQNRQVSKQCRKYPAGLPQYRTYQHQHLDSKYTNRTHAAVSYDTCEQQQNPFHTTDIEWHVCHYQLSTHTRQPSFVVANQIRLKYVLVAPPALLHKPQSVWHSRWLSFTELAYHMCWSSPLYDP